MSNWIKKADKQVWVIQSGQGYWDGSGWRRFIADAMLYSIKAEATQAADEIANDIIVDEKTVTENGTVI